MRLIFIRHGDPDYAKDSLTEKGWREARLLGERVASWRNITEFFVSPLGRAQDTARVCLQKAERSAQTKEWLKEMSFEVPDPAGSELHHAWDWLPEYWTAQAGLYTRRWYETPPYVGTEAESLFAQAAEGIDALLESYGYKRAVENGEKRILSAPLYRTAHAEPTAPGQTNDETTLAFFCHFGITAALMAHLFALSPVPLWQNFFCPTTSVTVLAAEERQAGTAAFRAQLMGCTKHLSAAPAPEPVSASGYFTDAFSL